MTMAMLEYELESEYEGEGEYEGEYEEEGEYETELFFGRLAGLAQRAARSPALRRVGLAAARTALRGAGPIGGAIGGAPGSAGARTGQRIGGQLGALLGSLLPQREYESEFEAEVNPIQRVYPDVMMEHLGHAATEAESEAEAEAFIGALVPIAARLIPRVAPAIMRAAPQMVRGLTNVTRMLRRNPATRPLVRTLPTVMRRTAADLARQSAGGRPVTPQAATRALARQTARVIGSPQQCVQAYRRSQALDRRFHRAAAQREDAPAQAACPNCGGAREW
jgi:hypothetical protein